LFLSGKNFARMWQKRQIVAKPKTCLNCPLSGNYSNFIPSKIAVNYHPV